ncbi:FixH protein [Chitinophaga rupis]|uniref:FixH protein n=1 Tax=Chitinophaga rupis TaxID=573321 RepID=A0A1H7PDB9_9BACT|nr:FixH family protein [Chitinophaga rupis]SEL33414.1 FixH protein [Chitinophaga rupis]
MKTIHWGHKIILVFLLFAAGIITLVVKSIGTKIDMVTTDYYGAELKYQQVIDGRKNTAALSAPVSIIQATDQVLLTFPAELQGQNVQGQVLFYRPSDAQKDFSLPLTLDEQGRMPVGKQKFIPGSYRVKIQWTLNSTPYFQETALYIH